MSEQGVLRYVANPTASQWHADVRHQIHAVFGPWGCGKSQAAIWDVFQYLQRHPEADVLVVRDTYSALGDSCVRQWMRVLGELGVLRESPPQDFRWKKSTGFTGVVKFRAAEKPQDVQKFLSVDVGMAWLEEVTPGIQTDGKLSQGLPPEIFAGVWARCRQVKEERRMVLTAAPPPNPKHWTYRLFYEGRPLVDMQQITELLADLDMPEFDWREVLGQIKRWNLTPQENRHNLPPGYYASLLPLLQTKDQVKRMVGGQVGSSWDGTPVYGAYDDERHCREMTAGPGLLLRGWDGGGHPACVWAQLTDSGRLMVLGELVGEVNMGIEAFAMAVQEHSALWFGERLYRDFGDETLRNKDAGTGKAPVDYLREQGVVLRLVKNAIAPRLEAVRQWMTRLGSDGPLLLVHPRCEVLREGFRGAYKLKAKADQTGEEPEKKHPYSDVQDCLQYLCLGIRGGEPAVVQPTIAPGQIDQMGRWPTTIQRAQMAARMGRRTHRGRM